MRGFFLFITAGGSFFFIFSYRQTRPRYADSSHRHGAVISSKLVTPQWVLCVEEHGQRSIFLVPAIMRAVVTKQTGLTVPRGHTERRYSVSPGQRRRDWIKMRSLTRSTRTLTACIVARVTADEIKDCIFVKCARKEQIFSLFFLGVSWHEMVLLWGARTASGNNTWARCPSDVLVWSYSYELVMNLGLYSETCLKRNMGIRQTCF